MPNDPALLGNISQITSGITTELSKVRGESTLSAGLPVGRQAELTSSAAEQALSGQIAGISIGTLLVAGALFWVFFSK